jgi:hypothetical protein
VSESSFTARLLRINAAWRHMAGDNSATGSQRRARVLPDWFNTRGAAEAGIALADQLTSPDGAAAAAHGKPKSRPRDFGTALQRWRNYRKLIAPLLKLRELDPTALRKRQHGARRAMIAALNIDA